MAACIWLVLLLAVATLSQSTPNSEQDDDISATEHMTTEAGHPEAGTPGLDASHLAVAGQFPEAAAVLVLGQFMCSGSVVAPDAVLTAAVCLALIPGLRADEVAVVAGSLDRGAGGVAARSLRVHPQFRYYPQQLVLEHDLALVLLARPLDGKLVSPISLPLIDADEERQAQLVGWGETGSRDSRLHWSNETLLRQSECASFYRELSPVPFLLDAGHLCSRPSTSLCNGASGSGLRVSGANGPTLVGVAGPAASCPSLARPETHTRVAHYLAWIRENLEG